MQEIVAGDIGGTHARFAIARIDGGRVVEMDQETTLKTADYASLALAWRAFGEKIGRETLPPHAALAIATPVHGDVLKMTNNPWVIQRSALKERLQVEEALLINDFGAVGHAVAHLGSDMMQHLCGPKRDLPSDGTVTIVGPGTGLGAACLHRHGDRYSIIETEGGHIDFAPLDNVEDRILHAMRERFRRVSAERIVSGPGLSNIYEVIAGMQGKPLIMRDNRQLWEMALEGSDPLASAALERFCLALGAFAGDLALAHGASGVVVGGGLGQRLAKILPSSGFADRFTAKGRFSSAMSDIPVKIVMHPQPGLYGAAAAYAEKVRTAA